MELERPGRADAADPEIDDETCAIATDRPDAHGLVGTRIGRYELSRVLGAGGMGIVFEAFDCQLERGVALKLVQRRDGAADSRSIRQMNEALALAKLSHPNVVAVHDAGLIDGSLFIAMELCPGETLDQWLGQQRRLPDIMAVLCAAGRGLSAAHAQGLVHRDFKPKNVIISEDQRVRVLDFGLASATSPDDASEINTIEGTPAYMAPEQVRGGPVDHRADQFAFCQCLYEALYGVSPFSTGPNANDSRTSRRPGCGPA